jgi:hypothetical protein
MPSLGPTPKDTVKTEFGWIFCAAPWSLTPGLRDPSPSNVKQVNSVNGTNVNIVQGFNAYGTTAINKDRPPARGSGFGPRQLRRAMSRPMAPISKEVMDSLHASVWFRGLTEAKKGEFKYLMVTRPCLMTAAQATPDKLAFIKFISTRFGLRRKVGFEGICSE